MADCQDCDYLPVNVRSMRRYDGLKGLWKHPGPVDAVLIEWRARQIADPLRRLQYLRGVSGGTGRRFGRPRHFAGLALLLIPFLPVRETVQTPPLMNLQS